MRNDVPRNVQGRSVDPFSSHAARLSLSQPAQLISYRSASPDYRLPTSSPLSTHCEPTIPHIRHISHFSHITPNAVSRGVYVASGPPSAMGHDGGIRRGGGTVRYCTSGAPSHRHGHAFVAHRAAPPPHEQAGARPGANRKRQESAEPARLSRLLVADAPPPALRQYGVREEGARGGDWPDAGSHVAPRPAGCATAPVRPSSPRRSGCQRGLRSPRPYRGVRARSEAVPRPQLWRLEG